MPSITKTIDVSFDFSLDDMDDDDLIDEMNSRGYSVNDNSEVTVDEADDDFLIKEVESRGYNVSDGDMNEKEMLAYIISLFPEEKIGSEKFIFQSMIRELYNRGKFASWRI